MIKKEVKEKWLKALRSGKYKQGRRQLHKNGYYCCLGVLCNIVAPEYDLAEKAYIPTDLLDKICNNNCSTNPFYVNEHGDNIYLSVLNDDGVSFTEVANIIEKEF